MRISGYSRQKGAARLSSEEFKATKVLFMGTPEFAVPSLAALIEAGFDLVGVVTRPERPKGRGRKAAPTPVKVCAQEGGIKVIEPERLDADFLDEITALAPDFLVVVAYGKILPKAVLDVPRLGAINLHASLLPAYRGAGPINRAIINGDKVTGTTTMFMDEGMDTGDMLLTSTLEIGADETAGELSERMARDGAPLLVETLRRLIKGDLKGTAQDNAKASYAPMLKKADGLIQWNSTPTEINNRLRGLSPWPGAYTTINGKILKIHKGRVAMEAGMEAGNAPDLGVITNISSDGIRVCCAGGEYIIEELQLEGKRRMTVKEFLMGYKLAGGERLG